MGPYLLDEVNNSIGKAFKILFVLGKPINLE